MFRWQNLFSACSCVCLGLGLFLSRAPSPSFLSWASLVFSAHEAKRQQPRPSAALSSPSVFLPAGALAGFTLPLRLSFFLGSMAWDQEHGSHSPPCCADAPPTPESTPPGTRRRSFRSIADWRLRSARDQIQPSRVLVNEEEPVVSEISWRHFAK